MFAMDDRGNTFTLQIDDLGSERVPSRNPVRMIEIKSKLKRLREIRLSKVAMIHLIQDCQCPSLAFTC